MNNLLNKIIGDLEAKKEWKEVEARARLLPEEYYTVYEEIKRYVWQGGIGAMDPTNLFKRLVELFEKGVADSKHVSEITGNDIAAFVDGLIQDKRTYIDDLREKLNNTVAKKIGK